MTSIVIALLQCFLLSQANASPGDRHLTKRKDVMQAMALNPAEFDGELKPLAIQVASVYARHPMDASVLYYVAAVHARAGHTRQALDALRVMADLETGVHPRLRDGFEALKGNAEFEAIADGIRRQHPPVRRASVALEIGEADLVPEGIAWSDRTRRLYLGSIKRKIVSVTRSGEVNEFVAPGTGGLGVVMGLRVDDRRGELWAASGVLGPPEPGVVTGAFRFRLSDGHLISSYPVPHPDKNRLNDLAVAPDGTVYGTATDSGALFRIDPSTGNVTEFLPAEALPDPNGITIPPDGRYAFVAGWYGIARVDLRSRETVMLEKPSNIADGCFDGLYSTGARELIGVQNCVHETGRIVRLRLDSKRYRLMSAEVLESYNPLFDGITTAAPAGRELMFVANVQFWKLRPGGPPFLPLKVLRLPLR